MTGSSQPPYRRRQLHPNPLLRLLPEIEALCGVEGMLALDRGAPFEDVQIHLVSFAIEELGDYRNGHDLLLAWVEKFLLDTMWIRQKWSSRCSPILLIAPFRTLQLLSGGWMHLEVELEFERVTDIVNLPLVHEEMGALLPPPPDELFQEVDDLNDPFRPF